MVLILAACLFACTSPGSSKEMNGFELDGSLVPENEIMGGGPPRDGIPAIHAPKFATAAKTGLDDGARILGIYRNGIAKAYPIAILNWHEIVNDRFVDEAVVISYCPLCGTGMAFSPEVAGRSLRFGVSGLLYNSDVLLYDLETESLWSQIKMQAVSGPLKRERLRLLALAHTTLRDWKSRHPDTLVLNRDTGYGRNYDVNPYAGYEQIDATMFPVSQQSDRYHAKELVLGLYTNGHAKAWPFSELKKAGSVIRDQFNGQPVSVRFDDANSSARVLDETGMEIPGVIAYWFAWYAFYPDTEVYVTPR